ncbi:hypothetical protein V6N13_064990 [Hibiscus sabdariffa]|uniref:Uncharacterized protein n=2 Tax=Hibiscus sabdariffa TaxID=183260 RepID=A0ABR1ZXY4_9ROSI
MDPIEAESRKEGEIKVQHIGHEHPLLFTQHQIVASEEEECFVCWKPVEGWSYGCNGYVNTMDLAIDATRKIAEQSTLTFNVCYYPTP